MITVRSTLGAQNGAAGGEYPAAHVVRAIALHGVIAEIVAPCSFAPALALFLGAYPDAAPGAEADIRITVTHDGTMWCVAAGEQLYREFTDAGRAAHRVDWLLLTHAIERWTDFIHVHAALVATATQSTLLIGRSGRGKSTTSVALALAGLSLYTDDVALINRRTLRPVCVPRSIKLDQGARQLLAPRGLVVPGDASLGENINRSALPGLPPLDRSGPPLATAIFLARERHARAELRPLTGAEAVIRLTLQSGSERFDAAGPSNDAVALVNAVRCYELVPGDLDATVQVVLDLLQSPDPVAVNGGSGGAIRSDWNVVVSRPGRNRKTPRQHDKIA